jgi:hypothetical protein
MFGGSIRKLGVKLSDALKNKSGEYHEKAAACRAETPPNSGMALSHYTVAIAIEAVAEVIESVTKKESEE